MKLLNVDTNAKTVKGQKVGYMTGIMYLAPYDVAGISVCPMSELAGCQKTCLFVQGRARASSPTNLLTSVNGKQYKDNTIIRARIRRTEWFHSDREGFLNQLEKEVHALIRKAKRKNLIPTVRLNGTSDIRWENVRFKNGDTLFDRFPDLQWYDYTKIGNRRNVPDNYHLSWSYSGANQKYIDTMPKDLNTVVVFNGKMPDTFLGRKVVDGDKNDLRFLDGEGVVVGLKAKGSARYDQSGFVVHTGR